MYQPSASSPNYLPQPGAIFNKKQAFEIFGFSSPVFIEKSREMERLKRFEIFWLKKGKVSISVDDHRMALADNSFYCLLPGCMRSIDIDENADGYYLSFEQDFIYMAKNYKENFLIFENTTNLLKFTLNDNDPSMSSHLEGLLLQMNRESNGFSLPRTEILQGLLNIFILYFSNNATSSFQDYNGKREKEIALQFMQLLNKSFYSKKLVCDYARDLNVTPNYLNKIVKSVSGKPASYHIKQKIILETKRLIIQSSTSMKEIAYKLGFDNCAHFSKYFKNNTGLNFTDFKREFN